MKKTIFTTMLFIGSMATELFAQCATPVNLSANYNNNVSVFTWDAVPGAVDYNFELKWDWDNWADAGSWVAGTNSYSLTGLVQGASFEWRVTTNCGTSVSTPSAGQLYTTPCPEPGALNVTSVAETSVTLNWTAAAGYNTNTSDFAISYRIANSNNNWTSLGHTSNTSMNVTGLLSNTAYEWCVNQSCLYSNSNPVIGQFTTAYTPCDIPTNLVISNATSSTANVTWSGVNGGVNYSIEIKPVSSSNWSAPIVANATSYTLTGLNAETLYDCRVKANCSSSSSGYVASQFTTYSSTCMAYGVNSGEFIDYFKLGGIERTSGKEIGGYVKSSQTATLTVGSSYQGQFSAGFNPGIVFGEKYAIYIDFNNNGSFGDSGERILNATSVSGGSVYNFSVSIGSNKPTGMRKMRVIMRRSTSTITPCATGFQGEVEDYNVLLVRSNSRSDENAIELENETIAEADDIIHESKVYPNPSTGVFTVESNSDSGIKSYSVQTILGQKVMDKIVSEGNVFNVDIRDLPEGIYVLTVIDNEGNTAVYKLQKQ